jgi:hypothetical protein
MNFDQVRNPSVAVHHHQHPGGAINMANVHQPGMGRGMNPNPNPKRGGKPDLFGQK